MPNASAYVKADKPTTLPEIVEDILQGYVRSMTNHCCKHS